MMDFGDSDVLWFLVYLGLVYVFHGLLVADGD